MRSDCGLQHVIGAALTDDDVLAMLLRNPLALANRFELTLAERRFIVGNRPRDLEHFALLVEGWSGSQSRTQHQSLDSPDCGQLAG